MELERQKWHQTTRRNLILLFHWQFDLPRACVDLRSFAGCVEITLAQRFSSTRINQIPNQSIPSGSPWDVVILPTNRFSIRDPVWSGQVKRYESPTPARSLLRVVWCHFGALASLGEPQSVVQSWATWPLLWLFRWNGWECHEWLRLWIGHVTAYICVQVSAWSEVCRICRLNMGCDLAGVGYSYPLTCPGQTGSRIESGLEEKLPYVSWAIRRYALIWNSVDPYAREPLCKCIFDIIRKWP